MNRRSAVALGLLSMLVLLSSSALPGCKRQEAPPAPPPPPVPPAGMLPPGPGPALPALGGGVAQRIAVTEQLVAQDPKNLQAWIQLGNDYFDTHQAQKSIDAYARALALDPNNADVITDQGVMYREIGQFDKALANFEKASKLSPRHQMSLYNAGVVLAYDKKDPKKATEAWNRVIAIDPASPTAAQARSQIQAVSGRPPGP